MNQTDKKPPDPQLRATAEARLAAELRAGPAARPSDELLHELQVHQIELEMQNETLRQSQMALEESRDRYVDFYDFSPVGYLTLTEAGLIAEINLTGAAMLGTDRAKLLQRRFRPFVAAADGDRWHRHFIHALQQDVKLDCELALQRPDGTRIDVRLDNLRLMKEGHAPALRMVLTDITESKRAAARLEQAQAQLLQSAKMAALGQLAAGVAHEINNPVAFVRSNFVTLQAYVDALLQLVDAYRAAAESAAPDHPALHHATQLARALDLDYLRGDAVALLPESMAGVDRVTRIVRDLLNFTRADTGQWQTIDLHACLESTINVVLNEIKSKVDLIRKYGTLPPIACLPAQLSQVFMNLLINAAQAIAERGTITLRSGREGDAVWVAIEDSGTGIAPDVMPHIYEPFFTTKAVGMGSGLGLSVAYGIIESHRGRIEVRSEPGKGTSFTVWLPIDPNAATGGGGAVPPAPTF